MGTVARLRTARLDLKNAQRELGESRQESVGRLLRIQDLQREVRSLLEEIGARGEQERTITYLRAELEKRGSDSSSQLRKQQADIEALMGAHVKVQAESVSLKTENEHLKSQLALTQGHLTSVLGTFGTLSGIAKVVADEAAKEESS